MKESMIELIEKFKKNSKLNIADKQLSNQFINQFLYSKKIQ